jgi:hypothetical protein
MMVFEFSRDDRSSGIRESLEHRLAPLGPLKGW